MVSTASAVGRSGGLLDTGARLSGFDLPIQCEVAKERQVCKVLNSVELSQVFTALGERHFLQRVTEGMAASWTSQQLSREKLT